MNASLLVDLQGAIAAQDADRARAIAEQVLAAFSPSGALAELAARNELLRKLDELSAEIAADQAVLKHLDDETLVSRLEDDFARCVPALVDAAGPLEAWAIPLLSALAGPGAPLLSFGLSIAVKVALAALKAWAAKRMAGR